jgi:hypothetical protein
MDLGEPQERSALQFLGHCAARKSGTRSSISRGRLLGRTGRIVGKAAVTETVWELVPGRTEHWRDLTIALAYVEPRGGEGMKLFKIVVGLRRRYASYIIRFSQ